MQQGFIIVLGDSVVARDLNILLLAQGDEAKLLLVCFDSLLDSFLLLQPRLLGPLVRLDLVLNLGQLRIKRLHWTRLKRFFRGFLGGLFQLRLELGDLLREFDHVRVLRGVARLHLGQLGLKLG